MCATCGCSSGKVTVEGETAHHHHGPSHHGPSHGVEAPLGAAHAPGVSPGRIVQIERDILSRNDACASAVRADLAQDGILALNLVSSPGSGKTTLLVETIEALGAKWPVAVIEGDQQTDIDAGRIRATGASALQVNTGKGCHLDAEMIARAIGQLEPGPESLLFIENVGNLVCPAGFDLGEAAKVVILSVTEGDDKPLKYPDMFRAASLMVISKSDLLPYVPFDVEVCIANARRINPRIEALLLSASKGDGMAAWLDWIEARQIGHTRDVAVLSAG